MSFLCLLGVSALSVCSLCVSAQQRMCEQLTRVVDIVAGLPPFQATFEKAPVSERLVIVMALGPYAQVQSDTSGHVRAQFSKFAAANSADPLRLPLRCPLPGLMLQAAQLAKTQIEEFILNCHQAGQKWDCVCLVDEIFDVGASHMSVFDEVPENSVLITQPHLRKDQCQRAVCVSARRLCVSFGCQSAVCVFVVCQRALCVSSVCQRALFVSFVCQRAVCVFFVSALSVCHLFISSVSFVCQRAVCVCHLCFSMPQHTENWVATFWGENITPKYQLM